MRRWIGPVGAAYRNLRTAARVDDGQGLVEYALVLLFVALAVIAGVGSFSSSVQLLISNASAPFR